MNYSKMWKDFHFITVHVFIFLFVLNAVLELATSVPPVESLLWAVILMLIAQDKKEWYNSPDPEPEERDESDGWFS